MILSWIENGKRCEREIASPKFDVECEVLCIGAGCAGMYAALAAAREGADTLLIENDDAIGGMHILGNVIGYYYGANGGSFESDDPEVFNPKVESNLQKSLEKQIKVVKKLKNHGVKLNLSHTPTAVLLDNNRVCGIVTFNGEREIFIGSKMVIDATSDGHVLRMCGVRERIGKETDGTPAPFTIRCPYTDGHSRPTANYDAGYVNQYDLYDFSNKAIAAHAGAAQVLSLGKFVAFPTHTGVREGIAFEGVDTLTYQDVLFDKKPEKVLFYAYSDLDRHGDDKALYEEEMQNFWVVSNLPTVTIRIAVPLGCVVPRGLAGIVTAGRCLSADSHAGGAVRMVRDMFRMGECVGTAAAMAVRESCGFYDINYGEYEHTVRSLGCFAGDESKSFGFSFPRKPSDYTPVEFNARKNLPLLKTETPGACIWSCYLERDDAELRDTLYRELISESDTLYRYNLAIALGIMSDLRSLDTLREIISVRDGFTFKDCRRSNQLRSAIAVCLVGRLGDESDISVLSDIAFSDSELALPMYDMRGDKGKNNVYFQMFSHAAAALVKIHRRLSIDSEKLKSSLEELISSEKAVKRVAPLASADDAIYTETVSLLKYLLSQL
ncbi:MAG: FAD-dependent oxidoreductase [Clostridia bacterium]|nr:FAD-dependent oxidoreductase [Clostridia bacterium]